MSNAAAVIPAAGSGLRMGLPYPKQFHQLAGCPLFIHALRAFCEVAAIGDIVLVVPEPFLKSATEMLGARDLAERVQIVRGGKLRQDSVQAGLAALSPSVDLVAVHDGARPLVTPELIRACLAAAEQSGAAIAALPVKDTLKAVDHAGIIQKTVEREGLWQAQTPQVIRLSLLRRAYETAAAQGLVATDEAGLLERLGYPVKVVPGAERNLKITRPEDLLVAEALLAQKRPEPLPMDLKIGNGYDAHRLVSGRRLVLGGVTIAHPVGLLGHSDADVLTHAFCDALLGALGAGDIGRHFPDTEPRFKDADSLLLLAEVMALVSRAGYRLGNADLTIIAQRPKLAPYLPAMVANYGRVCRIDPARLNIKATTTEQMGFEGREEGIAAQAVVLLTRAL